jgi:phosphatidylglycerophosphate synthase
MMDDALRRAKDALLTPLAKIIGDSVSPTRITLAAGGVALLSAIAAQQGQYGLGLALWYSNRFLDGLDGVVARVSGQQSDLGGYVDTLVDFATYTIIPFGLALREPRLELLMVLAFLFGAFYINAAAFLYLSAILERRQQGAKQRGELTTITMPRGIIEGTEAIVFFTLFFLLPDHLQLLFLLLGSLVLATTLQHLIWAMRNLR